jgi:hypothetical protein
VLQLLTYQWGETLVCLWKLWIEGISIQAMCGLAGLQSQVNVQGLRNVIDAVKANPSVKKLVYTSSFFALGYTDGHIGDEDQVISQSLTKIHHYQARTLDNVEPVSESLHWLS